MCMHAKSLQLQSAVHDPMDCSLQAPSGASVHRTQARILEWVVGISTSRGSSRPRDWTQESCLPALACGFFNTSATWEAPGRKTFLFISADNPTQNSFQFSQRLFSVKVSILRHFHLVRIRTVHKTQMPVGYRKMNTKGWNGLSRDQADLKFSLLKLWKECLALKSMACTPILEKVRFQILLRVRFQILKISRSEYQL